MIPKSLDTSSGFVRRVLVTGGCGFVGRLVLAALARAGYGADEVFVLGHRSEGGAAPFGTLLLADLQNADDIRALVAQLCPTGVIHLAAMAEPARVREAPMQAWQVNFMAVVHLIDALRRVNSSARFIFAGSSESYGAAFRGAGGPVSEDAALQPETPYGATKAAADVFLGQVAREGFDAIRFRAFNHTAAGQVPNYVIPAFARQIAQIEHGVLAPVMQVGNLDVSRDFLDARDVANAYVKALERPRGPGYSSVYNICSGRPRTIRSCLQKMLDAARLPVVVETDPARLRPNEVPLVVGDNQRACDELGWSPQIGFDQTLLETLQYWRQHTAVGRG